MSELTYKSSKELVPSIRELWRKGGPYQRAADKVSTIIGRINSGDKDPFRGISLTNHGESRIPKCVKYDLTGFSRLITIQDGNVIHLCFAGDHSTVDAWIERNRGRVLRTDGEKIIEVFESLDVENPDIRVTGTAKLTSGNLYEKLPAALFDTLVDTIPRSVQRELENIETVHTDEDIYDVAKKVNELDRQAAIYDSFVLLRNDLIEQAINRIQSYTKEFIPLDEFTPEQIARLADTDKIHTIPADDPNYQKVFEYFVKSAAYLDWMLYLHPDQNVRVNDDYAGPAKLVGVSGSGKTCVVVKRAIRLAAKYPGERIVILTLNRPLARLIRTLVDSASPEGEENQIEVLAFFELCQRLLKDLEPHNGKLYDDKTWKSEEHIDEIWREYYRCELNNFDAKVLLPVHDSLISRNIAAETYIREEFDWIRSAVSGDNRENYLEMPRAGRSIPFPPSFRSALLDGLLSWERKMRHVGVTDYLGLSAAVYKHISKLHPIYRCILVDESQDFGTVELEIIRRLCAEGPNDLFLCGDAAQQVSAKHQNFSAANIDIAGARSFTIIKNYRNSREILTAAFSVLADNIAEELLEGENFELLDPEYANFSGPPPLLLKAYAISDEIAYALKLIREEVNAKVGIKGCIAFCGYSLYELDEFSRRLGLPLLDGSVLIETGNIFLSDLEQTKGFEFDVMCIVNCSATAIPNPLTPKREQFRDLTRFYVAMTRAKNQLVLSYSNEPSPLLKNVGQYFLEEDWCNYIGDEIDTSFGIPHMLEVIRRQGEEDEKLISNMTGAEFLYTNNALGLSGPLIEKIRLLIRGARRTSDRNVVEWPNMQEAVKDVESTPRSRQMFGPETSTQFLEMARKVELLISK